MEGSWLSYSQGRRPACFTLTVSHAGELPGDKSKRRPNGAYDKPKEVGQGAHCGIVVADDAWQGRWAAIILPRNLIGPAGTSIGRVHQEEFDMEPDEDLPVRKRRRLEPLFLDTLSVEELRDYIGELRDEIARVEADIGRKQSHRSAADAFFKPR
jgi:uncharacterized small protein (DUF1192 family)